MTATPHIKITDTPSANIRHPLLEDLMVVAGGCASADEAERTGAWPANPCALVLYCSKGGGWCEVRGSRHPLRGGDLAILPPNAAQCFGAQTRPRSVFFWIRITGRSLPELLKLLRISHQRPMVHVGEDWQFPQLCQEIMASLRRGNTLPDRLLAAKTMGHLLALAVAKTAQSDCAPKAAWEKTAQAILYMSENLNRPVKVRELATLTALSVPHFIELFKEHTGSPPHHYLHLLRMHRACLLLAHGSLRLKEIAARLGYQDQFHFSRSFKAFHGLSPSTYRLGKARR